MSIIKAQAFTQERRLVMETLVAFLICAVCSLTTAICAVACVILFKGGK